jgi:hypothetical protein
LQKVCAGDGHRERRRREAPRAAYRADSGSQCACLAAHRADLSASCARLRHRVFEVGFSDRSPCVDGVVAAPGAPPARGAPRPPESECTAAQGPRGSCSRLLRGARDVRSGRERAGSGRSSSAVCTSAEPYLR